MENFTEGDVVQLKSGGPKMTISMIGEDRDVHCQWFKDDNVQFNVFSPESLIKVED